MNRDQQDPLDYSDCFSYLGSDIPAGLTLQAWRCQRARAGGAADRAPQRRSLRLRLGTRRPRTGRGSDQRSSR